MKNAIRSALIMAIQATWTKVKIIGIFFGRKVPLKVAGESKVLSRIVDVFFFPKTQSA